METTTIQQLSTTELKEMIRAAVDEALDARRPDQTMTSTQVCQTFGISRVTLWRWINEGKITPIAQGVGRKRLFRAEDVKKLLKMD